MRCIARALLGSHGRQERYSADVGERDARVSKLDAKLTTLRQQYRQLEWRRKKELEGFTNDITQLRRKLRRVEGMCVGKSVPIDPVAFAALRAPAVGAQRRRACEAGQAR